jgi:hypothetical protein
MITFDLVADPSTKGAYPSLAESKQHAIDFVQNVIKPAISEQAFVARLKKKLNESAKTSDNPWAICTAQVGRSDKKNYEDCVMKVKKKVNEASCDTKDKKHKHKLKPARNETGPAIPVKESSRVRLSRVSNLSERANKPLTLISLYEGDYPFNKKYLPKGDREGLAGTNIGREILDKAKARDAQRAAGGAAQDQPKPKTPTPTPKPKDGVTKKRNGATDVHVGGKLDTSWPAKK